jgi:hypothetical protein
MSVFAGRFAVLRAAPILHILERSRFFGAPGEPRGRSGSGGRHAGAPGSLRGEVQIADRKTPHARNCRPGCWCHRITIGDQFEAMAPAPQLAVSGFEADASLVSQSGPARWLWRPAQDCAGPRGAGPAAMNEWIPARTGVAGTTESSEFPGSEEPSYRSAASRAGFPTRGSTLRRPPGSTSSPTPRGRSAGADSLIQPPPFISARSSAP